MWISIYDGTRRFWVKAEDCYLANGELAFVNERIPRPLPSWFEVPQASTSRHLCDNRDEAQTRFETRSMQAAAEDVVAFYRDRTDAGGLSLVADPVVAGLPGRCCPGYSAASTVDRFSIDVYQWRDLAFSTTFLSHPDRKPKSAYAWLRIASRSAERVTFESSNGGIACWAPANAVTDVYPFDLPIPAPRLRREPERRPWSQFPPWLQFSIPGRSPWLTGRVDGAGEPVEWAAYTILSPADDPYAVFNDCLRLLDSHGFDPTGAVRQARSYYLRVWQRGQIVQACIRAGSEGEALLALLNADEKSLLLRFGISGAILGCASDHA
jgi:hypothetical protein